jgi:hypothetical protein
MSGERPPSPFLVFDLDWSTVPESPPATRLWEGMRVALRLQEGTEPQFYAVVVSRGSPDLEFLNAALMRRTIDGKV